MGESELSNHKSLLPISVVMTVLNGERHLEEAICSILGQDLTDFELIVVDDGSTDKTPILLNRLARTDHRIRLVKLENSGCAVASNAALRLAHGKYIARLDADDIALPQRLSRQYSFLEANPDIVAVGSNTILIDEDGWEVGLGVPLLTHEQIEDKDLYHGGCGLQHPTLMVRHNVLRRIGGYRPQFRCALDLDLCLRLGEVGRLANLQVALVKYRLTLDGITIARRKEQQSFVQMAMRDAWERRGLAYPVPTPTSTLRGELTIAEIHREMSLSAVNAGFYLASHKHAIKALVQNPGCPSSWKTLSRALLGPFIVPCRKLRLACRSTFEKIR